MSLNTFYLFAGKDSIFICMNVLKFGLIYE